MPGEDFYIRAFWDLTTERQLGMAMGSIPWSKIDDYGRKSGLDSDTMDLFRVLIRELDNAYLKWASEQQDRARKMNQDG